MTTGKFSSVNDDRKIFTALRICLLGFVIPIFGMMGVIAWKVIAFVSHGTASHTLKFMSSVSHSKLSPEILHGESLHDESLHDESLHDKSLHDESLHDDSWWAMLCRLSLWPRWWLNWSPCWSTPPHLTAHHHHPRWEASNPSFLKP